MNNIYKTDFYKELKNIVVKNMLNQKNEELAISLLYDIDPTIIPVEGFNFENIGKKYHSEYTELFPSSKKEIEKLIKNNEFDIVGKKIWDCFIDKAREHIRADYEIKKEVKTGIKVKP